MVRRFVLVFLAAVLVGGVAFAQVSAGVEGGIGAYINDEDVDDVNRLSVPILATAYYRLPMTVDVPSMGETVFDVGVNTGWMHVFSASGTGYDISFNTIPILITGEARVDNWFAKVGLGVHAWTLNAEFTFLGTTVDGDDNGVDFASTMAVGYLLNVSSGFDVKMGIQTFALGYETSDGSTSNVNVFNLLAGVQYAF